MQNITDRFLKYVSFVTPGQSFGVLNESGHLLLGLEDEVTWGVTFDDVNGTTFPFNTYAYWDWYGGVVTGSDLRTFDERPILDVDLR